MFNNGFKKIVMLQYCIFMSYCPYGDIHDDIDRLGLEIKVKPELIFLLYKFLYLHLLNTEIICFHPNRRRPGQ
jgi:hypothetical protein